MEKYTLGDFRRLTKELPDDTPIVIPCYDHFFGECLRSFEPQIKPLTGLSGESGDFVEVKNGPVNNVISIVF